MSTMPIDLFLEGAKIAKNITQIPIKKKLLLISECAKT